MLLFFDLDRSLLIQSRGCVAPICKTAVPRGAGEILRVQLLKESETRALPEGFEMTWTGRMRGDYAGDTLLSADTFVFDVANQWYEAVVSYESEDLEELKGDAEQVLVEAQLSHRVSAEAHWQRSQLINLTVHNSVWRTLDP